MSASLSCTLVIIKLDSQAKGVPVSFCLVKRVHVLGLSLFLVFSLHLILHLVIISQFTQTGLVESVPIKYKRHSNYSSVLGHDWSSLSSNYKSITVDSGIKWPLSWWKKFNSKSPGHSPDSFTNICYIWWILFFRTPQHSILQITLSFHLYFKLTGIQRDRKLLLFDQAHLLLPLHSEDDLLNITVTLWWM